MKLINVKYQEKPCYDIEISNNFDDLCNKISEIEVSRGKKYNKICIVSDSKVAKLHMDELQNALNKLDCTLTKFIFPNGEASKTLDTVKLLYQDLIINHFDRNDLLIAFGGGVVGDLTGYSAATYLRGIDFIQIPTTLLSMVDSSVGGKTGVDFDAYKNMVGAFYMPKLVYMNLDLLKTLENEQFSCGMAEVIKYGYIWDKKFYSWLKSNVSLVKSRDYASLEHIIYTSCDIKRQVVEEDPTEKSIRAYLNFGHTIGHAIEKLSDFKLFHGQCVAIGMMAALYLSKKDGFINENDILDAKNMLNAYDLPLFASNLLPENVLEATKSDKKMDNNKVKFVRIKSIGEADIYKDYSDLDLLEAIKLVIK